MDKIPHPFRKIVVGLLGGIFFVAGIIMIVTPGPAFVFIPLGLVLLASEFKWAERWYHKAHGQFHKALEKWREWKRRRAQAR